MANTLLTRISKLEQYDPANKTVLWVDGKESRWTNVYGQLQTNDNAIFITADDKLLIGTITQVNSGQNILCSNILEVFCSNDQFLQLHEIYPEQISRVKASFQPFIHPQQIDIPKLINDVNAKHFVSYYIIASTQKYEELRYTLKPNDRIIIINSSNTFDNVQLHSATGLIPFQNVTTSVKGLTLQEVLQLNQAVKRKSKRSNNVTRIQEVIKITAENGVYKFKTFFSYYDFLYNKLVYQNSPTNTISKIKLSANETVFKVSMSGKDINEEAFNYLIENNLVIVHGDTPAKGTSYQTQGETFANQIKISDYFYLCRGNNNLEVIGRITSNAEECEFGDLGDEGWLQRSYVIIADAEKEGSYHDEKKWWTPNDNSTCIAIPKNEIGDANRKIFIPFFQKEFEYEKINSENSSEIKSNNNMTSTLNQILFGPPGTGKTYHTINEAVKIVENLTDEQLAMKYKLRTELTEVFKSYLKKEVEPQIAFCTFHQSFSYEDFVEGIKPVEPKNEDKFLKYEIQDGVFKKMVKAAEKIENRGKRYVLIIDEINRGNISQIFGELITLIEKDKRQGESEELSVILPYSKKTFTVPSNLYIIGTMNTADRSIEALDTALRRRFAFREMLPKPELISTIQEYDPEWKRYLENLRDNPDSNRNYDLKIIGNEIDVNVRRMLSVINQRIEKLLDKDHTIGHSYLMHIENYEELVAAFKDKIIPLLEEFFYGDYGKIGLILGEKFVKLKNKDKQSFSFARFNGIDEDIKADLDDRKVYKITPDEDWDIAAFESIYKVPESRKENE